MKNQMITKKMNYLKSSIKLIISKYKTNSMKLKWNKIWHKLIKKINLMSDNDSDKLVENIKLAKSLMVNNEGNPVDSNNEGKIKPRDRVFRSYRRL